MLVDVCCLVLCVVSCVVSLWFVCCGVRYCRCARRVSFVVLLAAVCYVSSFVWVFVWCFVYCVVFRGRGFVLFARCLLFVVCLVTGVWCIVLVA